MKVVIEALLAASLAGAATAQAGAPDEIHPIDGAVVHADLRGLEPAGADGPARFVYRRADGREARIAVDRVEQIRRAVPGQPRAADSLWLRSGQVLPGRLAADGTFDLPFARAGVPIPWRFVQGLRLQPAPASGDGGFAARIANPPASTDLLYYLDNDRIKRLSVAFAGATGGRIEVRYHGAVRALPQERVFGLVFAKESGARPNAAAAPRVIAGLASGRRVRGQLVGLDRTRLRLRLAEGPELSIPRSRVAILDVLSERLVHLTALEPRVRQTPALDRVWPWFVDRAAGGGPIRMAGKKYRRGLVVVPRSSLSYKLDGHYDVLETTIGMEDRCGAEADAVFRVIADGRVVFEAEAVGKDTPPQHVRVRITDVQSVTLEVDFGRNLDIGDLCVFADPRVIKR